MKKKAFHDDERLWQWGIFYEFNDSALLLFPGKGSPLRLDFRI